MPKFATEVSHALGVDEARKRLRSFAEQVRNSYQGQVDEMQEDWDDNGNLQFAFSVMGMKIDGSLEIGESTARVNGNLPFAAALFRGKVEQEIKSNLEQALS